MKMNRRQFLLLIAMAAAGCRAVKNGGVSTAPRERVVDAGPVSDYATDGVYGRFRDQGFLRNPQGRGAVCHFSHLHASKMQAVGGNRSLILLSLPRFDCSIPSGRVTQGPARRDLPVFTAFTNEKGQLLVKVPVR